MSDRRLNDPQGVTDDQPVGADGPAALAREVERLTRNAVADRPEIELPDAVAALDHVVAYVQRPGDDFKVRDLEKFLAEPVRPRGTYTVYDAPSFTTLLKRLTKSATYPTATLWAQQPSTGAAKPSITAIINDHDADGDATGWRDHRAVLEVRPDPDWQAWEKRDGYVSPNPWMDQVTFAEFIIDQTPNIVQAQELYLAATTLQAHRSITFQSVVNLDTSALQAQYVEKIGNRENGGALEIPNRIWVKLRPFYGAEQVEQEVMLRYRFADGAIKFGLFRVRPDLVLEAAWNAWCESVSTELPELPLLQGAPPAEIKPASPVDAG